MAGRADIGCTLRTLAMALLATGCSGLRLAAPPPIEADDWPTAARTPARTGMTPERLTPPLAAAWSADLTGGTGATTLAVADSVLFATTLRGDLQAFSTHTGKPLGRVSLGSALTGAPALSGPLAIVPGAAGPSGLAAFDLADGSVAWRAVPGDVEAAPLLLGDRVVAGTTAGLLVCLSAARGDTLWTWGLPANRLLKGIRTTPASDSLRVFVAAEDGSVSAVRLENGSLIWRHTGPAAFAAGPLLDDTVVVACDITGGVVALGAGSGVVLWRADAGAAVFASPAAADGVILVGTSGGGLHAFRRANGTPVWIAGTGEALAAAPVVAGGIVYAGTLGKRLLALSLTDGRVLWETELGGRVRAQPVVARGTLFVATDERVLTAFRETPAVPTGTESSRVLVSDPPEARFLPPDRPDAASAHPRVMLLPGREDTLRGAPAPASLALREDGPSPAGILGMSGAVVSQHHSPDPPPLHLYVTGGVIVAAGAVSAVTKIAADDAYAAYLLSGDASELNRTRRLDRTAAVSLVITQISFALFTYFLLAD